MMKKHEQSGGPWALASRRLLNNKIAVFGGVLLVLIMLFTFIGPLFSPYDITVIDVKLRYKPPTWLHPFGTDMLGQDLMTQVMIGGRLSLAFAILSATVTIIFGTLIGVVSGYFGKWIDGLLMRFTEFVYVLPLLPMLIAFTALMAFRMPPLERMLITMIVFGFLNFPSLARLIRGEILTLKNQEFMRAAELLGVSKFSKMFKHLMPNVMGVVIASSAQIIANAILLELTLSFVGMGFPPPTPTWGNLIPNIRGDNMVTSGHSWLWFYPVSFISLTIISINLLGEGLRDALDPKSEGR